MKKIKKADLRLEKEVVSNLSQTDLTAVRGGAGVESVDLPCIGNKTDSCFNCLQTKFATCGVPLKTQNSCQNSCTPPCVLPSFSRNGMDCDVHIKTVNC